MCFHSPSPRQLLENTCKCSWVASGGWFCLWHKTLQKHLHAGTHIEKQSFSGHFLPKRIEVQPLPGSVELEGYSMIASNRLPEMVLSNLLMAIKFSRQVELSQNCQGCLRRVCVCLEVDRAGRTWTLEAPSRCCPTLILKKQDKRNGVDALCAVCDVFSLPDSRNKSTFKKWFLLCN